MSYSRASLLFSTRPARILEQWYKSVITGLGERSTKQWSPGIDSRASLPNMFGLRSWTRAPYTVRSVSSRIRTVTHMRMRQREDQLHTHFAALASVALAALDILTILEQRATTAAMSIPVLMAWSWSQVVLEDQRCTQGRRCWMWYDMDKRRWVGCRTQSRKPQMRHLHPNGYLMIKIISHPIEKLESLYPVPCTATYSHGIIPPCSIFCRVHRKKAQLVRTEKRAEHDR